MDKRHTGTDPTWGSGRPASAHLSDSSVSGGPVPALVETAGWFRGNPWTGATEDLRTEGMGRGGEATRDGEPREGLPGRTNTDPTSRGDDRT